MLTIYSQAILEILRNDELWEFFDILEGVNIQRGEWITRNIQHSDLATRGEIRRLQTFQLIFRQINCVNLKRVYTHLKAGEIFTFPFANLQ